MKVGLPRVALFASGDFAFNLYWQSVMLYLLFYYTEALHVPIRVASACYALALGWDGIVGLAIGQALRRLGPVRADPRRLLALGAPPLGASFALAYLPPPVTGTAALGWIVAGHMVFRFCYSLTNIPYLAMSARISTDSGERSLVAGGRMVAGTLAAVTVALGTLPLGRLLTGTEGPAAYFAAAVTFALVATVLLVVVAFAYRDAMLWAGARRSSGSVLAIWHNPAFRWFAAATVTMIVPFAVLDRSVLYYFTYSLGDQAQGRLTLGAMMAVSGVAVPLWLALSRRVGLGGVWSTAIGLCLAALLAFIVLAPAAALPVQLFLIVMQAGSIGLNFAMWALLPEILDLGRRAGDADAEAVAYGWLAMLQRVAIGFGTLLLGAGFGAGGARSGGGWLRLSLTAVPLGFLALSGLLMARNPAARRARPARAA